MDKPSDWVVLTQQLGYLFYLTQLLIKNYYIAGLKWTQNGWEIKNQTHNY